MITQSFTAERLNDYRREDLHASAAAVRTTRIAIGSSGRVNPFSGMKAIFRNRVISGLRPAGNGATVVAGR